MQKQWKANKRKPTTTQDKNSGKPLQSLLGSHCKVQGLQIGISIEGS